MNTGRLTEPAQSEVLDARRICIRYIHADKLMRERATAADPWGVELTSAIGTAALPRLKIPTSYQAS